jgi:cation transport ATPase
LHAVAQGFAQGVVFKRPAALDHLASADLFVFDDSADLTRPVLSVSAVETASGIDRRQLLQYALSAPRHTCAEQSQALWRAAQDEGVEPLQVLAARLAGVSRYRDDAGRVIEVASGAYLQANQIDVPERFAPRAELGALRPLWVLREGELLGKVAFARKGEARAVSLLEAIKAHAPNARVLYVSSERDVDARALAASVGIETVYAGLTPLAKAELVRGTRRATVWIGDGTLEAAREPLQASTVSISMAAYEGGANADAADVWLGDAGAERLAFALSLARAHAERLARDYRTVYSVNLLGVAGAVVARITSLQIGLLSNAGTWVVYARRARALDRLAADAQATRERLIRALHP